MSVLTNHFERVTVISLTSRMDRRERLVRHFSDLQLVDEFHWTDAMPGNVTPMPDGWSAGQAAWGCLQSHLKALGQAQADGVESVLILEDDVVFSARTARCLPLLMASLPDDWGQFYLGGQHVAAPSRTQNPLVWRAGNINRAHAWAGHARHLQQIIDHLGRLDDYAVPPGHTGWHLDHQLGRAHEQKLWPCYASSWWLAAQEGDTSDICGQALRRRWWHPRRYALSLPVVYLTGQPSEDDRSRYFVAEEEEWIHEAVASDALLVASLHAQAEVALDYGCLPAWRSPHLSPRRVRDLWPAGVLVDPAEEIHDYPFNDLFRHSLTNALREQT